MVSHTILGFPHQVWWQCSDGDAPDSVGALYAAEVGKSCNSWPISVSISQSIKTDLYSAMHRKRIRGSSACCQWFDQQVLYTQLRWIVASRWHSLLVSGIVCCSRETRTKFYDKKPQLTPKITEQNLIVCSGKSEADCARGTVLLKLQRGTKHCMTSLWKQSCLCHSPTLTRW